MKKTLALFAVLALVVVAAAPAEASWRGRSNGTNIDIAVDNSAYVSNSVYTKADTGDNEANGGDASSRAHGRNAESYAGGGNGGRIVTGEAVATSVVTNTVNSNDIVVRADCGCKGKLHVDVDLDNSARVNNDVKTKADTGDNEANGGDADSSASSHGHRYTRRGHGGADSDAEGGNGGNITTGRADALSQIVNTVNTNIVRVIR